MAKNKENLPAKIEPKQQENKVSADFAGFQPDDLEIDARPAPVRSRWTLYAMLLLIVMVVSWACLAKVDRIVTGTGKVISAGKNFVIQPLETSLVKEILVRAGQRVKKGQPLVLLDATFAEAGHEEEEVRLESLLAQVWRLECETSERCVPLAGIPKDELALQRSIMDERREEYESKVRALDKSITELAARLHTNERATEQAHKQIGIAHGLENMYKEVFEKGASSKLEYMRAQSGRIEAVTLHKQLLDEHKELEQSLARAKAEREGFIRNWKQTSVSELVQAKRDLDMVEERERKASRLRDLVELKAPADGIVLELAERSNGSVVNQGEPIMTIVPSDVDLEAEVSVQARNIGFIRPGDPVRVKLEAFPFQRHGVLRGKVRFISPDAFEQETPDGQALIYRTRVEITVMKMRSVPKDFKLVPGMSLTAEIKVG